MKLTHAVCLSGLAGLFTCSLWAQSLDQLRDQLSQDHSAQRRPVQSQPAQKPRTEIQTNTPASSKYPVVGYLEKRGRTIIIKSGPKGPLYSVKDEKGKTLFENLSAEQLRAQAPDIHEFLKTAMAQNGAKSGAKVDASLRIEGRR